MIQPAVALYRERYGVRGFLENTVYPGIEAMLRALHAQKMVLYVATSKPTLFAERIVEHFGLARYFRAVYGSELDGTRSGKSHLLSHLLAREDLRAQECAMVGDRAQDIAAARANGVHPVGALWGYGSEAELVAAGARVLCPQPSSLPGLIAGLHA